MEMKGCPVGDECTTSWRCIEDLMKMGPMPRWRWLDTITNIYECHGLKANNNEFGHLTLTTSSFPAFVYECNGLKAGENEIDDLTLTTSSFPAFAAPFIANLVQFPLGRCSFRNFKIYRHAITSRYTTSHHAAFHFTRSSKTTDTRGKNQLRSWAERSCHRN